jgi:hypothetical protein
MPFNLIVFSIMYFFIFLVMILGFFFSFYEIQTVNFITQIANYFFDINSDANTPSNIDGTILIKYYLYIIFILGLLQELILIGIKAIFKKDFHQALEGCKRKLFFMIIFIVLIIECGVSFILKEWWLSLIAIGSSFVLTLVYLWYELVSKIINYIKSKILSLTLK